MELEIDKYEDIYRRLKKCFDRAFGNGRQPGLISMNDVKKLIDMRRKPDLTNNLPKNSLIEIPVNLYGALKETYISRDPSCVSGFIGCAETETEQLDGIINTALLMYLSNHLSKKYKFKAQDETDPERKKKYKENEKTLLKWKDISLSDIIALIYVLSKTSEEYNNYFSYGNRLDDEKQSSFVVDLPYIGQICVHFGWDENKNAILKRAQDTVKSILEKKMQLGQITEEQLQKITVDLEREGVLPEYEGKLYEYVAAMPIEYIGEKIKECRKLIGNKLPENITSEDVKKLRQYGLNQRELYYFFIKMGVPKDVLNEISGVSKKITPKSIEEATDGVTIEDFNGATRDLRNSALENEIDPNTRT